MTIYCAPGNVTIYGPHPRLLGWGYPGLHVCGASNTLGVREAIMCAKAYLRPHYAQLAAWMPWQSYGVQGYTFLTVLPVPGPTLSDGHPDVVVCKSVQISTDWDSPEPTWAPFALADQYKYCTRILRVSMGKEGCSSCSVLSTCAQDKVEAAIGVPPYLRPDSSGSAHCTLAAVDLRPNPRATLLRSTVFLAALRGPGRSFGERAQSVCDKNRARALRAAQTRKEKQQRGIL